MYDKHLSSQFDSELNSVSSNVLELGGLVEMQIRQAIYALSEFSVEVRKDIEAALSRVAAKRRRLVMKTLPDELRSA